LPAASHDGTNLIRTDGLISADARRDDSEFRQAPRGIQSGTNQQAHEE
jgi:hypothetical protein